MRRLRSWLLSLSEFSRLVRQLALTDMGSTLLQGGVKIGRTCMWQGADLASICRADDRFAFA